MKVPSLAVTTTSPDAFKPSKELVALKEYVLEAMTTWAPLSRQTRAGESLNDAQKRYEEIASTIAVVAGDEEPAFDGPEGRAKTALVVASIAFWESAYILYVDAGLCNDPAWVKTQVGKKTMMSGGDCDGGLSPWPALAASMWQIQTAEGLVLTEDGYSRAFNFSPEWRATHESEIINTQDIVHDRTKAARLALHIARQSIRNGAGLCQYSGEKGPCPKAALRLDLAVRYSRAHPFAKP